MPHALREIVYQKGNLQIRPSFLVDGLVAGTWSAVVRRREATLTLRSESKLAHTARKGLSAEGEGLLAAIYPAAKGHNVVID
jgi:hypothetical protein